MIVIGGVVADDILCDTPVSLRRSSSCTSLSADLLSRSPRQGIYVYNVSSSSWQNSFEAGSIYSTPALIANITGGIGTGGSSGGAGSATGGDGSQFPDTSGSSNPGSGGGNGGGGTGSAGGDNSAGGGTTQPGGSSGGGTNIGAIAGGVVAGVVALALLAFLAICLMRRRKRERQLAEAHTARDKLGVGAPLRSNSGSSDGRWGTPYEKQGNSDDHNNGTFPASDDVEEETRGMEATFGSSHLVPRQQRESSLPRLLGVL